MTFFGDFPFYYDDRAMKDTEKKLTDAEPAI